VASTDLVKDLRCSFCGKLQDQIDKLVAGPGVYICNECVDLCNQIIAETLPVEEVRQRTRRRIAAPATEPPHIATDLDGLTDAQLIDTMVRIHASHDGVDRSVQRVVSVLRTRGVTWARIGGALGMTRQSAWERFSGEE
jgi:hypothetical protein